MSGTHGEHGHHHHEPESALSLRVRALESLLVEKKLVASDAIDRIVAAYEEDIGPHNGAKVVARACSPTARQRSGSWASAASIFRSSRTRRASTTSSCARSARAIRTR